MPTEPETIVVTGRRETRSDGTFVWTFMRGGSAPSGIRRVAPQNVSENPEAGDILEIVVRIEKTNANTDDARLQAAAEALIKAIARALVALESADPSRVVAVNGVAVNVSTLLNALLNTDFKVSDRPDSFWANGGVGAAVFNPSGRHRSTISYRAIGGDPSNSSAGFYDHPNFQGRGMLALVLHEAFHLTPQGDQWYNSNVNAYRTRHGANAPFSGSAWDPYRVNTERLINQMALAALSAINEPPVASQPPFDDMQPPVDPSTLP